MRSLVLPLLLAGCTASQPGQPRPSGEEVTLFVPGYRGSFLVDEHHRRAWLTPGAALSRGEKTLALPFPGERAFPGFGRLEADGPMTRFIVLPLVANVDIYLAWLRFGQARLPGFVAFSYDWRQDIRRSAGELCELIDTLVARQSGHLRVNIVAHSMGGLVALYCLRYGAGPVTAMPSWAGAAHVQKVVFAGTPFEGSPGIFDDFFVGTDTARNRALMSREALFTFPSAFELLPPRDDFFVDPLGKPLAVPLFDPPTWWSRGWGVFEDPSLRTDEAYQAQLRRMLAAHDELAAALSPREGPAPSFSALAVIGQGRPVIRAYRASETGLTFEAPLLADGDGTVLADRAHPPAPMSVSEMTTRAEHVGLLGDRGVQEAIASFLTR